jgi:hypothetical protein
MRANVEAIPSGALGAFVNMLLILVTIWIANGADFVRERLHQVRSRSFWPAPTPPTPRDGIRPSVRPSYLRFLSPWPRTRT